MMSMGHSAEGIHQAFAKNGIRAVRGQIWSFIFRSPLSKDDSCSCRTDEIIRCKCILRAEGQRQNAGRHLLLFRAGGGQKPEKERGEEFPKGGWQVSRRVAEKGKGEERLRDSDA